MAEIYAIVYHRADSMAIDETGCVILSSIFASVEGKQYQLCQLVY